ncbi:MAG: fused MFS/spermidine synthase [Planctomycetes bacterium]|nr:fused MFS/spermidine synthase [Planctomycetota bacterium]
MVHARSAVPFLTIAGVAGAATMAVELAAVRLLAPWFGASSHVWTNVIGVILLALAIGYLAGARLASRADPRGSLAWVLLFAAAWTMWLPATSGPVCRWLLPPGLTLDQSMDLWTWGSLAATLVLFLPAAVALGCVGPLAVECVQRADASSAGSAGGRVLGYSTLGSLVGTFGTTHQLVPWLGIAWTFLVAGSTLFVLGLAVALAVRRRTLGVAVIAAAGAATGAWPSARVERNPLPDGVRVIAEGESTYQSVRVVEDSRWGSALRLLQVNEGLDSFQSVWAATPGLLGLGYYYDLFALPCWWSGEPRTWKVLVLGLGAGTTFRVLRGASPIDTELTMVGVEIDPLVVDFGRRFFDLDPERDRVLAGLDARSALSALERDFDLIVLDAYARQVEIPFHLASAEAMTEMRAHLAPGGWLAVNVGGFGFDDPVVEAVAGTTASVFGGATAYRVPFSRNYVVFARERGAVPRPQEHEFACGGPVAEELLPALSIPGAHRVFERAGARSTLSDDRNPIDQLQFDSLRAARARIALEE